MLGYGGGESKLHRIMSLTRPVPHPPGPGQESVWDYPRPPALDPSSRAVRIEHAGAVVAETTAAIRILETSHPPTWAIPPSDVDGDLIEPAPGRSVCEWKGVASYWTVVVGEARAEAVAWSYPKPTEGYESITDHLCFYAARMDRCTVDGEVVVPQPGAFYGGWITSDVVGPFKGEPGTMWW